VTKQLLALSSVALVVAIDINANLLEALLPEHTSRLEIVVGDISKRATSEQAIEKAISRAGRLDCIILNAAIQKPVGPIIETRVEDWQKLFDINFFALLHTVGGIFLLMSYDSSCFRFN
jgi:NAD(P)-dependent dehydrogenase (short-subunit alcohol dehydrogenase family)